MTANVGGNAPTTQQKEDLAQAFDLVRVNDAGQTIGPDGQVVGAGSVKNFKPGKYKKLRKMLALSYMGISGGNILFIGNSTTAPLFAGSISSYCAVAQFVQVLRDAGLAISNNTYCGGVSIASVSTTAETRVVFPASPAWGLGAVQGIGGACPRAPAGQTTPATFTPFVGQECDQFVVDYAYTGASGVGSFGLQINSGEIITVNKTTVPTVGSATITGTLGNNTLRIIPGGVTETTVMGIRGINTAKKEILVWNGGLGGSKVADWFTSIYPLYWRQHIQHIGPTLVVLRGSINDWKTSTQTAFATYSAKVTEGLDWLLAQGYEVLIETDPPSEVGQVPLATQRQYAQVLIDYALAHDLAYSDPHAEIESYEAIGGTTSGAYLDTLHPDKWPYGEMGRRTAAFILDLMA